MKILVTGGTGMLGAALHRGLHDAGWDVAATVRGSAPDDASRRDLHYVSGVEVLTPGSLAQALAAERPDVVINAVGVIKQLKAVDDHPALLQVNSVLPRRLAEASVRDGFRLVHFSTDCVFTGRQGCYRESDPPDATDMYGLSKQLGEPAAPALTLRTSIIGRGLHPNASLVDWFLAQTGPVKGFRHAVFSGLPVHEVARVLSRHILPILNRLQGLYHLAADPIDKLALLTEVRRAWSRDDIELVPDDSLRIDRSLDATRLREATGYVPPAWPDLVDAMRRFYEPQNHSTPEASRPRP